MTFFKSCSFSLLYIATDLVLTYKYGKVKIMIWTTLGNVHFKSEANHNIHVNQFYDLNL